MSEIGSSLVLAASSGQMTGQSESLLLPSTEFTLRWAGRDFLLDRAVLGFLALFLAF